jgi:hypothetical protein
MDMLGVDGVLQTPQFALQVGWARKATLEQKGLEPAVEVLD